MPPATCLQPPASRHLPPATSLQPPPAHLPPAPDHHQPGGGWVAGGSWRLEEPMWQVLEVGGCETGRPAGCSYLRQVAGGMLEACCLPGGRLEAGGWLEAGRQAGWRGCGSGCGYSVLRIATEPNRNSAILAIHLPLNAAYVSGIDRTARLQPWFC